MGLDLNHLEQVATAALGQPWKDNGVTYEGDGAPGLSIVDGPGPGGGVAFVSDFCGDNEPLPKDYLNQAHILAFQPATALALVARIQELELRLIGLADGARSKANVLASGSPTSKHYNPVQILKALADEAEKGIGGR